MAPGREAPGPDGTLGGLGLCPIAAQEKPVAEVLTDVAFRQLVQEQVAAADVALLRRGENRDDETVADVDVELVPGPAADACELSRVHKPRAFPGWSWRATKSPDWAPRPLIPAYRNWSPRQIV